MRQGHQNRRGRNRNNNGARKSQNPVTRSYESNGPEMKIRGTPAHIAEKYIALSRDAQSNGDPVLSENYLQHAEHYNRIILAYRDQQTQQSGEQPHTNGGGNVQNRQASQQEQPVIEDGDSVPQDGQPSPGNGQSQPRRQARSRDRQGDNRSRQPRGRKPRNGEGNESDASSSSAESGQVAEHEQPEFLRRSIRRPRRDAEQNGGDAVSADDAAQD